ncbi:ATP-binding protein [Amycolatopsis sp. NPDC004169]|uniref:HD domain-containing protein n=1 Tax=Amycolatopsis sp. NPDC004169 TaxID=3154453 RepID=UPI0033A6515D
MTAALSTSAEQNAAKAEKLPAFSGFSLTHLRGELTEALSLVGRLGIFEEYTKHDISHIDGLLRVYDWLIPTRTQKIMTPADWLLIVLASYLHDFGLLVTRNEYENRTRSGFPEYKSELHGDAIGNADILSYIASLDVDRSEQFLYQEFVRKNHAARIRSWLVGEVDENLGYDLAVTNKLSALLANLNSTFVQDLALVCESHHLDDIYKTQKYPVSNPYGATTEETANVQYSAILLRVADLLHITRERVPSTAFQLISPRNPTSQLEWAKQDAVRSVRSRAALGEDGNVDLEADRDTIEVHATFHDSDGFFGLTTYLQYASKELAECNKWAANSVKRLGSRYEFPWRKIDTTHVKASGFVANPFEFQIDQHKILDLLTGHTLYNDTGVVVRELVQNAIDAVRLENETGQDDEYEPAVSIRWNPEDRLLSVTDNGTGMTQEVIEANFLRVGSSRYSDPQFVKEHPNYSAISRFGIGVLSAFMVADDVQVVTVSRDETKARQLTLRTVHGQYLIKLLEKASDQVANEIRRHGTHISLRLRQSAKLVDVFETLRKWIVIPRCKVAYKEDGQAAEQSIGHASVKEALREVLTESGPAVESAGKLVDRFGSEIQIRESDSSGIAIAYAVRWNRWFSEWEFLPTPRQDAPGRQPNEFALGICVEGIRVTKETPGFAANTIWSIVNATGHTAPRTNVARDALEVTLEYNELFKKIYSTYVDHIKDEIQRIKSDGSSSLTRAVREASYLSGRISSEARFPSGRCFAQLSEALEDVPAFLVEESGERMALSLHELNEYPQLVSVESKLVQHMEYVLNALPANVALTKILSEFSNGTFEFSSAPLICGQMHEGPFNLAFRKSREITTISADGNKRQVLLSWSNRGKTPIWITSNPRTWDFIPSVSEDIMSRLVQDRRQSCYVPAHLDSVHTSGLDGYDGVSVLRELYLLPHSPLMQIRGNLVSETEEDETYRVAWVISVVASLLLGERNSLRGYGGDYFPTGATADNVVEILRVNPELDFIDLDSVREAINGCQRTIFDINQWERDK